MIYKVTKKDRKIGGSIQLGGSKSISNRVLIIEALMQQEVEKMNLSDAADTRVMQNLLHSAGNEMDAHDAGTVFRFLTAYLAFRPGTWILTGSERMKQRPVGDLVDPLRELGARIEYLGVQNFPPLKITGGSLKGGHVKVHSGISSQFASALLMIGPYMPAGLTMELTGEVVSQPYIDLTLSIMKHFGVSAERTLNTIQVPRQNYVPASFFIESDWSAASYYYEMAAFSTHLDLTLTGLQKDSFQGDAEIATYMLPFGVVTSYEDQQIRLIKKQATGSFNFNLRDQPDLAPAMFVTCGGLSAAANFTGLNHLQYKESNRETALATELEKFGIMIGRSGDQISIQGKFSPNDAVLSTYLDHRMAMAFAPLAMLCGEVLIENPMVVQKSYPEYWDDIQSLGFLIKEL